MRIFTLYLFALPLSAWCSTSESSRIQFVEVLETSPQYVQVPCDVCGPIPDIRFTGTKFQYQCNGKLYANWSAGEIHVGARIQVIDCENVVVTKDREPVVDADKIIRQKEIYNKN